MSKWKDGREEKISILAGSVAALLHFSYFSSVDQSQRDIH